jgi:hypothetical protein
VDLDPDAVFLLIAAICRVAQRDAKRGRADARDWLAGLVATKPKRFRVLQS